MTDLFSTHEEGRSIPTAEKDYSSLLSYKYDYLCGMRVIRNTA